MPEQLGGKSRWSPSTLLPSTIRKNARNLKYNQLLQESAALIPNEADLMKELSVHDISPVDNANYQNILRQNVTDYMSRYRENPFFSFTREGITKVRELQHLVTDPRLKGMEEAYKLSQEEVKRAKDGGFSGNVHVNDDGKISVYDVKDEETKYLRPEEIVKGRHFAQSINNLYDEKRNNSGFSDGRAIQYNMSAIKDVDDKIFKYFGGLGSHATEMLDGLQKLSQKGNQAQIQSRINSLLSDSGLSQADKNTLLSEVYTNKLNKGENISRADANKEVINSIFKIANGYLATDNGIDANPVERLAMDEESAKTTRGGLIQVLGSTGLSKPIPGKFVKDGNGREVAIQGVDYPMNSLKSIKNEDSGNQRMNIKDITQNTPELQGLGDWGVISEKDGSLHNLNGLIGEDMTSEMQVKNMKLVSVPIMANGQAGSPFSEQDVKNAVGYKYGIMATVRVAGADDLFADESRHNKLDEALAGLNYTNANVSGAESKRYYEDTVNAAKGNAFGNNFYDVNILSNFNSDQVAAMLAGTTIHVPKDVNTVGGKTYSGEETIKRPMPLDFADFSSLQKQP